MKPEVSIILPTYNSQSYIAQAIRSVLQQTFKNWEMIVIDDASTDATLAIARSFHDSRIKFLSNKYNRGVSHSRNRGLAVAQGNWIALLDSDDWYAPDRLEQILAVAQETNADLIADNLYFMGDETKPSLGNRASQPWSTLLQEQEQTEFTQQKIDAIDLVKSDRPNSVNQKRNWSLGYTKPLIKKAFLTQYQIQYNERINVGEDYILYLECLSHKANFVLIPEAYYYYRTRSLSLSTRKPIKYLIDSCEITNIFIRKEIELHGNSQLLKTLIENLTIYQKRLAYYHVIEAIKQRQILVAVEQIAHNPYTLAPLFSKIISMGVTRLRSMFEFQPVATLDLTVAPSEK